MHGKGMKEDAVVEGMEELDTGHTQHVCIQFEACTINIGPGLDACMAIATYHGGGC